MLAIRLWVRGEYIWFKEGDKRSLKKDTEVDSILPFSRAVIWVI